MPDIGGTIQNMAQQFMGANPSAGGTPPPAPPSPAQPALNNTTQYGQNTINRIAQPGWTTAPPVGFSAPQQTPGAPGVAQSNYNPGQINVGQPASIDMGQVLQQMLRGYGVGLGATRPGAAGGQVSAQVQNNIPALIQMLVSHLQANNAASQIGQAPPGQVSAWV
jgi:hypothetical protein